MNDLRMKTFWGRRGIIIEKLSKLYTEELHYFKKAYDSVKREVLYF